MGEQGELKPCVDPKARFPELAEASPCEVAFGANVQRGAVSLLKERSSSPSSLSIPILLPTSAPPKSQPPNIMCHSHRRNAYDRGYAPAAAYGPYGPTDQFVCTNCYDVGPFLAPSWRTRS